tara:strand:- start:313 stop:993 length:681 start_codon:yes stop_codon:yes gene_type:complete
MLRFFISLFTVFFVNISHGNVDLKNDTIEKFGIRAGVDLNKIIRSASNSNYTGLSINGDIRIKKSLYIFSEIGNEEKKINSDYLNSTVKGTYLKVGTNFKLNNDIKTENLFYSGLILGFSNFNQSIDNYTIYNTNSTYWGESYIDESLSLSNLNAVWFEIVFGLKTEIFNNLFLGFELQLKNVLKQKNSQGITNFYIPGFNRTYDSSDFGAGFSYTISYLIPIIKK